MDNSNSQVATLSIDAMTSQVSFVKLNLARTLEGLRVPLRFVLFE